ETQPKADNFRSAEVGKVTASCSPCIRNPLSHLWSKGGRKMRTRHWPIAKYATSRSTLQTCILESASPAPTPLGRDHTPDPIAPGITRQTIGANRVPIRELGLQE